MKSIFSGLLSLTLLIGAHLVGAEQAFADYDVEWSPDVLPDVRTLADVSAAMDREGFAILPLNLSDGQTKENVRSCSRYLELKELGFAPVTRADQVAESQFVYRCQSLRFLASARKSPLTYLAREFTQRSAYELPACFGEISHDSSFWSENNNRVRNEESLANRRWDFVDIDLFSLAFTKNTEYRSLKYLVMGDVNGDGIEDALIGSSTLILDLQARKYEAYRVTRLDPMKEAFVIIEQAGPTIDGVIHGCPKTF